jgi:capsular exopolysaccharide synthesis family protein
VGIGELIDFVRRYGRVIGLCALAGLAIGSAYLVAAKPVYVAQTQVFIDPKRPQANGVTEFSLLQLDSSQLESQIQIVKSERISRHVVQTLGLAQQGEFNAPAPSLLRSMMALLGDLQAIEQRWSRPQEAPENVGEMAAIERFTERLSVRRIGQSYVLEIAFWSESPHTAARVANAVTATYIRDQIISRLDAAQRGGEILKTRIEDLRGQLATVDQAVLSGAIQLETFPVADGRVLTSATLPQGKSWPKSSLVLALATLAGMLVGGVSAVLRNAVDNRVRSRRQIETGLQVPLLGTLPLLPCIPRVSRSGAFTYAFSNPHSFFSNRLRVIKTEIDIAMLDGNVQCIGVVSALPGEGRSTVACNLAHAFFAAGRRVLLMDCDVRTRALSKTFAGSCQNGLLQILSGAPLVDEATLTMCPSGLPFLPLITRKSIPNFNDVLGSDLMRRALHEFRQSYDLVFIDLPATSSCADSRAISPHLDAIIVVAEFDTTPSDTLSDVIQFLDRSPARMLGVVLNQCKK